MGDGGWEVGGRADIRVARDDGGREGAGGVGPVRDSASSAFEIKTRSSDQSKCRGKSDSLCNTPWLGVLGRRGWRRGEASGGGSSV